MWDDTNAPMKFKPSTENEQRLTYSQYYIGNCAKIGVFITLCGWMGVGESLWTGSIVDTDVMKKKDEDESEVDDHENDELHSIL